MHTKPHSRRNPFSSRLFSFRCALFGIRQSFVRNTCRVQAGAAEYGSKAALTARAFCRGQVWVQRGFQQGSDALWAVDLCLGTSVNTGHGNSTAAHVNLPVQSLLPRGQKRHRGRIGGLASLLARLEPPKPVSRITKCHFRASVGGWATSRHGRVVGPGACCTRFLVRCSPGARDVSFALTMRPKVHMRGQRP